MKYFNNTPAFFLFLISSSAVTFLTPAAATDDCSPLALPLLGIFDPNPCEVTDGVCPDTCRDAVDDFHTACSKDGANYNDKPYEGATTLIGLGLVKADDSCRDVILDKALAVTDDCQGWATLNLGAVLFYCAADGEVCPGFCRDMMDGFYDTCSSTDTFDVVDSDTGEVSAKPAVTVEQGAGIFASDTCKEYLATLGPLSGGPGAISEDSGAPSISEDSGALSISEDSGALSQGNDSAASSNSIFAGTVSFGVAASIAILF